MSETAIRVNTVTCPHCKSTLTRVIAASWVYCLSCANESELWRCKEFIEAKAKAMATHSLNEAAEMLKQ